MGTDSAEQKYYYLGHKSKVLANNTHFLYFKKVLKSNNKNCSNTLNTYLEKNNNTEVICPYCSIPEETLMYLHFLYLTVMD